jgi:hypothetical protein
LGWGHSLDEKNIVGCLREHSGGIL